MSKIKEKYQPSKKKNSTDPEMPSRQDPFGELQSGQAVQLELKIILEFYQVL